MSTHSKPKGSFLQNFKSQYTFEILIKSAIKNGRSEINCFVSKSFRAGFFFGSQKLNDYL